MRPCSEGVIQFHDVEDGEARKNRARVMHARLCFHAAVAFADDLHAKQVTHKLQLSGNSDPTCLEWQGLAPADEKASAAGAVRDIVVAVAGKPAPPSARRSRLASFRFCLSAGPTAGPSRH